MDVPMAKGCRASSNVNVPIAQATGRSVSDPPFCKFYSLCDGAKGK